ncbi:MAG TPA: dienelactone hydrolase family protein [Thermoleophilaceae bacterium]|nr:dienelactone hydrolase family protein [Thermoleophilaceae bacterium]
MCFDFDAVPPDLPLDVPRLAGGAPAEILELESADGTRFSAAFAGAAEGSAPAVVIYPDVRGLYQFYLDLAERFAEAGHHAVVIDYFGRTAGLGPRSDDFEYMEHVRQIRSVQVQADTRAALDALAERTGEQRAVSVGFCFGGGESFLATTSTDLGLAGAVGFYAGLDRAKWGMEGPLDRAADMHGPLLGLFGGADQGITQEQIDEFSRRLDGARVEHDFHVYPGAPHSFFDRKQEEFAEISEDAWRRVLAFLTRL